MKRKSLLINYKIFFCSCIFSILYWFFNNFHTHTSSSYQELYKAMNNSIYGYSSLQSYFLIYLPLFLIILNVFLMQEKICIIIRLNNRKKLLINRFWMIIEAFFIVFIPHFFINIINMTFLFNIDFLLYNHYYLYESYQILNVFMFYILVGLTYTFIINYLRKELSLFISLLIYVSYYFFNRIFIHYYLLRSLCIKELLIVHSYNMIEQYIFLGNILLLYVVTTFISQLKIRKLDLYEI
jgi:hypothetical protein